MLEHWRNLAEAEFSPHGHCYFWVKELIGLHVVSDLLIGLAYVAISLTLAYFVYRVRTIPFHWMFLAFGAFIIACGFTHFMEVWVIWEARYWLAGFVKLVTAIASVATALALPPLVPRVVALYRAAQVSEERRRAIEAKNRELEALYARVKELNEVKSQLFANVSHELRTPLTLILGPVERLLATGSLPAAERRDLEVVERNARTLLKHVNDLLDVSRLDAGQMSLAYADADLAQLVRLTSEHFAVLTRERGIVFQVEAPPRLSAQVDVEKVQRVLLNLLANAFKFVPDQGRILCLLTSREGQAVLEVRDSGPGVRPELRQAIFERFRQGEGGANRRFGGTGLGLAIARDFVALHGGSLTVDDAPEGGARFTATLPLLAPPGTPVRKEGAPLAEEVARSTVEQLQPQRQQAPATAEEDGRPLVLVVEDNPEMTRFLAETLATEYRVATARDGAEGLLCALELRPDLVLSDLMMPGHSGDDLVRRLRARPELQAVPLVLLTAKADPDLLVRLLREGAQDYLVKPFSVPELRARVGNLIAMKRTRDTLQRELASRTSDLEALACEVGIRQRELRNTLEAVRVARDHAERASQVKSTFLRLVSHELRTPLTAISLYLQSLLRDSEQALSSRQQQLLSRTQVATRRLLELIESLLEYTRLQSGQLVQRVEPIDLERLAADALEEFRPQVEAKHLQMHLGISSALPPLTSDPRLVRLILSHLVDNAVKFTDRGQVNVLLSHADGLHKVIVRDTGPGIPPESQANIFEPFAHLEPVESKHTPGVGLGLTLVREMVEALGGKITLESEPALGSTFTVVLPPVHERTRGPSGRREAGMAAS